MAYPQLFEKYFEHFLVAIDTFTFYRLRLFEKSLKIFISGGRECLKY